VKNGILQGKDDFYGEKRLIFMAVNRFSRKMAKKRFTIKFMYL
jgi:hypothetical protein